MKLVSKCFVGLVGLSLALQLTTQHVSADTDVSDSVNRIGLLHPVWSTYEKGSKGVATSKYVTINKSVKDESKVTLGLTVLPSVYNTTIEVPLGLKDGEKINLISGKDVSIVGAGTLVDKNNNSIGIISTSVLGDDGSTHITQRVSDGSKLVLDIGAIKSKLAIEIQVELTEFDTYFSDSSWMLRGGQKSLSIKHNPYFTLSNNYVLNSAKRVDAWSKLGVKHSMDTDWSNASGLKNQFDCHVIFAPSKSEWNIESSRLDVGFLSTVLKGCNP